MRGAVRLFLAMAAVAVSGTVAFADFREAKTWFNELPTEQRTAIQGDLTLLGHYTFLIDGQFGTGTYNALVAYQKAQGDTASGVLAPSALDTLEREARTVYERYGMEPIRDELGQSSLVVPEGLLTVAEPTANGMSWSTPDGDMTLVTSRVPLSEKTLPELFAELNQSSRTRVVDYSSFNDSRFVVAGMDGGKNFYVMYRNAGPENVGYTVTWDASHSADGSVIATYIASHFLPLNNAPPTVEEQKFDASVQETRKFGAFELANDPSVILFNGEIEDNTSADFVRALKARPDAKVLVLNSPGGYVDTALVIAREVHRRKMATVVSNGDGCYSACAYIFFAGVPREATGELGVHQISAEVEDLVFAQTTLGDVIDALDEYGVEQSVIVRMLRTPPEDMYVFSQNELVDWEINRGGPVQVADLGPAQTIEVSTGGNEPTEGGPGAYVQISLQSDRSEAQRSLEYVRDRWAGVLGDTELEIEEALDSNGTVFRVRAPQRSVESASALCDAIRNDGGGCYVTPSE